MEQEQQETSAERRGKRAGVIARAWSDLRSDRFSVVGLRFALGLLAAALMLVSLAMLGAALTLALLPLVLGVAIMAVLVAARLTRSGTGRLTSLADRLDASLESLKDLQWEVRERETRYRDLLDHQGDVILRRDADKRLTFVNDTFCRTFGFAREAALGQVFPLPLVNADQDSQAAFPDLGEERRGRTIELVTAAGEPTVRRLFRPA